MGDEITKSPHIRFAGFTDAWEQRKLEYFVDDYIEKTTVQNQYPVLTSSQKQGIVLQEEYFANRQVTTEKNIGYFILPRGYFTFRSRTDNGIFAFNRNDIVDYGIISYFYPVFLIKNGDSNFFLQFLNYSIRRDVDLAAEGTGQRVLSLKKFKGIKVIVPTIDEQQKIGEYFTNLDNLITLHQRKLELLKVTKKSMLQKMFPKDGESVPEIRFAGFTDAWEQRKLGELSNSIEYGLNAAAKEFDGKNRYIRITDINDESHNFVVEDVTSPDTDLSNADNYKLSVGDILFARTGASVGKSYIYKDSDGLVYYAGFLIRARIKEDYNPEFVFQNTLTKDYEKYITITSQRSGQPGVNAQEYSEYKIFVPKRPEQDKISFYLRNLDNIITLHQRELDLLKDFKKSMLQQMFI